MENALVETITNNYIIFFNSKDHKEIQKSDQFIQSHINIENFNLFKFLLINNNCPKIKFNSARIIMTLITDNYLSIKYEDKTEIYDYLLYYIV